MRSELVVAVFGLGLVGTARAQESQCPRVDVGYLYSDEFKEKNPTKESAYKEAVNFALDKVKDKLLEEIDRKWKPFMGNSLIAAKVVGQGSLARMLLSKSGDVVNAIKLADALVAQDWKTSREAVGELELGILAAVFPAAAPLIAAGKVVNAGWQSFNNQIFDANTETLYRVFHDDPGLLGRDGIDRFVNDYLFPPDERTALSDAQRRRAYVYEYATRAGVDLGQASSWRAENRRLLRSVLNRMRRDFKQRYDVEQKLLELDRLRGDLHNQIEAARSSGLLEDLTRFDSQAQRCADEIARNLLANLPQPPAPPVIPPRPPKTEGDDPSVKVFAWGRDDTDGSAVGWNSYYPNPSFDDDPGRRGLPNAVWQGQHWWQGDNLCLAVRGLHSPYQPGHTLSLGYEVHLGKGTFEDGTSQKVFSLVTFIGAPPKRDVQACFKVLKNDNVAPPPIADGHYVYVLTNASNGLYLGTEASLRTQLRCDFEGGGNGCGAGDVVTYRPILGPFSTYDEARVAFCAATPERKYFPAGIGLKARWQGGEWYGLWHHSVTGPCLGATQTEVGGNRPPPKPGYAVFLLTNSSDALHIGTEEALQKRTRCSFEGGGVGCTEKDFVEYRVLLGPFEKEEEATAAMCAAITERKSFPWGVGLKGRWQGSDKWYGLWDSTVLRCP